MGRPEKPVDRTVPARGKLADFLRRRKTTAALAYEEMARRTNGMPSKATLERAASGASVPSWETVETFIKVTVTKEEEFTNSLGIALEQGRELWIRARRATRAPYYVHKAPDPNLISTVADFSRALRNQHVWAGYPTPGEMTRTAGPGELPSTTTRRIIEGTGLPVDPQQAIAFLKACYVTSAGDLAPWLAAAVRAFADNNARDVGAWARAHHLLQTRAGREEDHSPTQLRVAA